MPYSAMAHTLVKDSTNTVGAIYHITPEDDPIAGKTTAIYFEVESKIDLNTSTVNLMISSRTSGFKQDIPVKIHDHTVSALFNFPVRELYFLRLSIVSNDAVHKEMTFTSSQQVTHSANDEHSDAIAPAWAKAGLTVTILATIFLFGLGYKRWHLIRQQSK